ncbi:hypothetical protein V2A60_007142 [Cordyceps javanica]|uniref:Biotrophy-associated secreted protein 2 n=1 Tax=Cordyceps javanica TaxID=43265 RepID=A0A545VRI0_9HYPO|nr:hypothetical protein IF1G_08970 [Cordyceps javanica]TQW04309.1 hypothetical protein IF2G_08079 [Cordyceps javanica]
MVRIAVAALLTFAVSVLAVGDAAGAANVGNGQGKQFITGACLSDADCASGCCAGLKDGAVCSARAVANEQGKQGCGFGGAGAGAGAGRNNGQQNGNNGNNGNAGNNGNNGNNQNCARSFTA